MAKYVKDYVNDGRSEIKLELWEKVFLVPYEWLKEANLLQASGFELVEHCSGNRRNDRWRVRLSCGRLASHGATPEQAWKNFVTALVFQISRFANFGEPR